MQEDIQFRIINSNFNTFREVRLKFSLPLQ